MVIGIGLRVKIKFYNNIPGIETTMPIIPISQHRFDWKAIAAKKFQEAKQNLQGQRAISISHCPGINLLHQHGWIIRAWQDIYIENDGIDRFSWKSAVNQKEISGEDAVSYHDKSLYADFKTWPVNSFSIMLKINTGWRAVIPRGYMLYQFPVPYSDDNRFTAVPGAYTWEFGTNQLNVPMYWHKLKENTVITAGTPLAHIILSPLQNYDYEILEKPDSKLDRLYDIMFTNSFVRDYKKIKDFFSRLIKN